MKAAPALMDGKVFGRRARAARIAKGMTVKQAAFALNWSDSNLRSLETGDRPNPTIRLVKLLAALYGIQPSVLIDDDDTPPKPGIKKRRCLSCRAVFESGWLGNRLCDRCGVKEDGGPLESA